MLIDRFQEYVTRNALFTHQDKILLTVSGGVDSMVLMSLCVNSGNNGSGDRPPLWHRVL